MSRIPSGLVVIIFAAAVAAAAAAPPLHTAAADAAQDFIRSRCDGSCSMKPESAKECNKLLLPLATSINGSCAGASLAVATAMVSELTSLVKDMSELERVRPAYKLGGCIRMSEGAIGGAKEQLATLSRFYALGDDKVGEFGLSGVMEWSHAVYNNFQHECSDGGLKNIVDPSRELPRARLVDNYIYISFVLICYPTPYSLDFVPSPGLSVRRRIFI